jgi:hypothetical protein
MRTSLTLVLAALLGCAGARPGTVATSRGLPFLSDHATIGADVLANDRHLTLYELVRRTWPTVLRPPVRTLSSYGGITSRDVVGVYADGMLIGGLETLQTIYASNVIQVRRLSRSEEFARFGRAHPGGGLVLQWRMAAR